MDSNVDSSEPVRVTVDEDHAGLRLDVFLAQQQDVESRSVAKSLIRADQVLVGDRPGKPGMTLDLGQEVVYRTDFVEALPAVAEAAAADAEAPRSLPVLHEDDAILVIDKPAGISVHPGDRKSPLPTVAEIVSLDRPDLPRLSGDDRPGIVHRLDKDTSGVMLLAKTEEAHHFLKAQFKERLVEKEYRAVAFGLARFDSDFIDRNIARNPRAGDRMMVVQEGGRESSTFYEVLHRYPLGSVGFTYFRCLPKTGRTHQIRVHLMSIGHSLVGDRVYRSRKQHQARLPEGAPEPGRHCLHAFRLGFQHPLTRQPLVFETPVPHDMQRLLDFLEEEAAKPGG